MYFKELLNVYKSMLFIKFAYEKMYHTNPESPHSFSHFPPERE